MSEGGTDEILAIAAIIGDAKLANEYEARALRHVQAVSSPGDLERNLNAVRTLAALANGRDEEAYKLASAASDRAIGQPTQCDVRGRRRGLPSPPVGQRHQSCSSR